MSAFSDNKGSAARILPCLTMNAAAHACFSVKNNSVFVNVDA